jgi:sulfotransferase family protein
MWSTVFQYGKKIKDIVENADQYIEVKYEDLRADPTRHLSSLFRWLGLETRDDVIAEIVEVNSLERIQSQNDKFHSIHMTAGSAVTPIANTAYPEGFFGRAPARAEDIQLSRLQRVRVENLVGDLLAECGYAKAKKFIASERLTRLFADVVEKIDVLCRAIGR